MRILLIEPDNLLAQTYQRALSHAGHEVTLSTTAQQAIHLADERTPEVVILELQLPGHNGVEFLYEFRSYSEWLSIPIIIHSSLPPSEILLAATLQRELGVVRVLSKQTTSLAQLRAAVRMAAPAKL